MSENEAPQGDEKLLILPLGEESKKITQVISNDTARKIIELLADAPLSASDIAERLQTPSLPSFTILRTWRAWGSSG
jgi:DNA-binding transcriptional ArsR family regulator